LVISSIFNCIIFNTILVISSTLSSIIIVLFKYKMVPIPEEWLNRVGWTRLCGSRWLVVGVSPIGRGPPGHCSSNTSAGSSHLVERCDFSTGELSEVEPCIELVNRNIHSCTHICSFLFGTLESPLIKRYIWLRNIYLLAFLKIMWKSDRWFSWNSSYSFLSGLLVKWTIWLFCAWRCKTANQGGQWDSTGLTIDWELAIISYRPNCK